MARTRPEAPGGDGAPPRDDPGAYTVVARRYRPRRFEDVVGQDHVIQALRNAIRMDRVAQAYLFSGTRGVGKTSMARIFAKCLNCVRGPTDDPCGTCDVCQAIAAGQDVDVIEIDGASNNGVDAVRELRQNAGLRPSRSRYKIYYIDEVHMLSTGAFNALLKTLEEPPEHVKFFFATTEKTKIPITVLSRCQVYEFAGIAPDAIVTTLAEICRREGVEAEPDALRTVARRAGGSMRDAQSLLEQLLSFEGGQLSADLVHQALGIAPDDRVLDVIEALADHDTGRALRLLDEAVRTGVAPVELLNGALEFLRDVMIEASGAGIGLLAASPSSLDRLRAVARRWPLDTVLATLQVMAEARARLRGSPHGRLLVELALCRAARLEDLADLGDLIARLSALEGGEPPPPPASKKKRTADEPSPPVATPTLPPVPKPPDRGERGSVPSSSASSPRDDDRPLSLEAVARVWEALIGEVGPTYGTALSRVRPTGVEGPGLLVIGLPAPSHWVAERCDTPEGRARIEAGLRELLGRPVRVRFDRSAIHDRSPDLDPEANHPPGPSLADRVRDDPLVKQVGQLFEARLLRIDPHDEADETLSP